jgi:CHASE1-domain containing sensor protein
MWGLSLAAFATGTAMSLLLFTGTQTREHVARRLEFERRAAQVAAAVRTSIDVPLEVLRSIPALYDASDQVTRAEFRAFVNHSLQRYPWIYALEWIPRVPGEQRAQYEARAVADGLVGFHFKEDAPSGPPVRARERPEYFPLYYMDPPHTIPLGLEETALDVRKRALERARDLDATVITERLKLVQDDASIVSVIAFHPVYEKGQHPTTVEARRKTLSGFAAAVFRLQPVVAGALRGTDLELLDVVLVDADAKPPNMLYESRPGAAQDPTDRRQMVWEQIATVAGRRWAFRVGDRARWVQTHQSGYTALIIGLLASAFAAAFVYAAQSALRLRRQVRAVQRLGQFTLVEKLGEGGMGAVYRAHHTLLRRPTAVKLIHPSRINATARARFEAEVQLTSSLSHPNTVVVYDYGHSPEGVFYYAMEYIDGITLQELVDVDGPQPPERVVNLLIQVCAALAEAHAIGLVHRDIKPANIMLCERGGLADFVKVLDFGLAKDLSGDSKAQLSQSTALLGTPLYLAPEVILGRPIDARLDVYAVGGVAYFLLTGTPVFTGPSLPEVCAQHMSAAPEPPSKRLGRSLPPALEALILQCLAKNPADRPASAGEFARSLTALPVVPWGNDEARRWWHERGGAVEERVRAARGVPDREPSDRTLEIDHDRQNVARGAAAQTHRSPARAG